jgi:hypothetical protein
LKKKTTSVFIDFSGAHAPDADTNASYVLHSGLRTVEVSRFGALLNFSPCFAIFVRDLSVE